jgi:putative endonuclease
MSRRDTGARGEELAVAYLKKQHYKILETNFRVRGGEIDIVAEKDRSVVFVEVRTKTTVSFGSPGESITETKKRRLINASLNYLDLHNMHAMEWQIDFIGIDMDPSGKCVRLEHVQNAIN